MGKVHKRAVDMIGQERAARATLLPFWTKHEMIDDQLAPAIEQVSERFLAGRSFKDVRLLHLDPGQFAPLPAQLIAFTSEPLLFGKQLFASRNPFFKGNDFVVFSPRARF